MTALLLAYFVVLGVLAALGLERLALTLSALSRSSQRDVVSNREPGVLVQLPLFNEPAVAERLLRAASRMRAARLRVQVLDDSTDETRGVVDRVAAELRRAGIDIHVVRRSDRSGFKAGALCHGLELAGPEWEFVAIFDADFVPPVDFIERAAPLLLAEADLGLVQARWGHLNRDESRLTRAQAVFLDGHFGVEHGGRAAGGLFFNFNGTGGLWRRAAIDEAGGWSSETITEDLDLSYRAQLAGWRFAYLHDLVCPAELPVSMSAFRTQQARWVKGSAQTARKLVPRVLRAPGLSLVQRASALLHLLNNGAYVLMAALAALLPAAVVVRDQAGWRVPGGQALLSNLDFVSLAAGTAAMLSFYAVGLGRCRAGSRPLDLVWALCIGAGLSVANARHWVEGLFGTAGGEFVRTPKRGGSPVRRYRARVPVHPFALEVAFFVYHGAAVAYALYWHLWGALPFLLIYFLGFGAMSAGGIRDRVAQLFTPEPELKTRTTA